MPTFTVSAIDSPLGTLCAVLDEAGRLVRLELPNGEPPEGVRRQLEAAGHRVVEGEAAVAELRRQLTEYFAGERRQFDLELAPAGTEFQQRVWAELQRIPYGETVSYGDIARRLGRPGASRAVGLANGSNPLPIVVPCHRVIGADGSLTGYGGGLEAKARLLELERGGGGDGQRSLFG
jgi:methylated-DNA-[protein]-cysteine S-methyltransferase